MNSRTATSAKRPTLALPTGMPPTAYAKWKELVPLLIARGVSLAPEDTDRLREYCEAFALRVKASSELADQPLTLTGPNGARYRNPLLKVMADAEQTMRAIGKQFGLDPKSRATGGRAVGGTVGQPGSDLMAFIMEGVRSNGQQPSATLPQQTKRRKPTGRASR